MKDHTCAACGKAFPSWQAVGVYTAPDGLGGREVRYTCSRECTPKNKRPREPKRLSVRTFGIA